MLAAQWSIAESDEIPNIGYQTSFKYDLDMEYQKTIDQFSLLRKNEVCNMNCH